MAKELDNKKMWASIRKESSYMASKLELVGLIDFALKEQGFKFDGEDIVPIAEVNEPQLPYVAIKDFSDPKYDNKTLHLPVFCKDEIVTKEKVFKMIPYMTEELFNECFRPNVPEQRRMELYAGGKISGQIGGQIGGQNPKFEVGDWVVWDGFYHLIEGISSEGYICEKGKIAFEVEKDLRLWSIADAKDGDVLVTKECEEPKIVFILKGNVPKNCVCSYYCYYNIMYPHFATDKEKGCLAPESTDLIPATREQRDILIKAMIDAGYTFDFEKKKLKKGEKKPAEWRKKDEEMLTWLCRIIHSQRILKVITLKEESELGKWMDKWLNHNPQPHWKPSDEQMHYLSWIANVKLGDSVVEQEVSKHLNELLEDLKKLREE